MQLGRNNNVPEDVYHAHAAIGSSSIKRLLNETPLEVHSVEIRETDSIRDGTGVHVAILEPERFEREYCIDPECPKRGGYPAGWRNTKDYKAEKASKVEAGLTPLPRETMEKCLSLRDRIYEEPSQLRDLLEAVVDPIDDVEVSYLADFWDFDLRGKARLDGFVSPINAAFDLKKTREIGLDGHAFQRQADRLGYWIQEAWYRRVCEMAGQKLDHFYFVAVQLDPVPDFAVLCYDGISREFANRECDRLFHIWASCVNSDKYPGHSRDLQTISVANWRFSAEDF